MREPLGDRAPPQRGPMRMIHLEALLLVDLPVDVVVVLEQQEGANEAKRIERALPQLGCPFGGEHVFVSYEWLRTEAQRTCVRTGRGAEIWLCEADPAPPPLQ